MLKVFEVILKKGVVPVFSLPHIPELIVGKVRQCKKFKDYMDKIDRAGQGSIVSKIELLNVEMFGEKVGFVTLRAHTINDGFPMPAYVFLRGPAVAILVFANNQILLVEQFRVPVQQTLLEAPAGMLDESGDFVGVAAAQIQEETSIKLSKESLHPLGSFYPSPGGCDQQLMMFYAEVKLTEEEMNAIKTKIHGKEGEKERIKVRFIDYDIQAVLATKDAKLISLVLAYENRHKIQANM